MSQIAEIIEGRPLIHADASENVRAVAQRMSNGNVGAVAVLDGGRLVGVFSERNVYRGRQNDRTNRDGRYSQPGEHFRGIDDFFHRLGTRVVRHGEHLENFFTGKKGEQAYER